MTNELFNALWSAMQMNGHIHFSDHGKYGILSACRVGLLTEYVLEMECGYTMRTRLKSYVKEDFRRILVDQ